MSGRARPLALGLLILALAPAASARAAGSAAESRGAPTQDGWWNRLQGPADGEPDGNPIRPLVPPVPKPPNVPGDAIAASAGVGQVDKVAAVGIGLALGDGATLDGLTLRLKESPVSEANIGAEGAKVTACPATVPWGPAQNAAWRERPTADCSLASADGIRAADGTWTFDLTGIGRLWAGPPGGSGASPARAAVPLAPNGVVLSVDPTTSPSPVQVSWLNFDSGNVVVELTATPAPTPATEAGPTAPEPVAAASPAPAPPYLESAAESRSFPASGGSIATDPFAYPSGGPTFAAVAPAGSDSQLPAAPAEVALAASPRRQGPVLRARPAVDFWEHVPVPTALLVPVTLGLAVLIGVVLGPTARPSPVFRREGGLSRALARRGPGGCDPA